MAVDPTRHPCFDDSARHLFGRVHLPVAPKCNVQCSFCNRKYDCLNESRPGVTSGVLSPTQALAYLNDVLERDERITVVGIAGPGDPFAEPATTLETLRLVRAHHPDIILCVASNGLNVAPYAGELADLDVSHVTVTINGVAPDIAEKVYSWVRHGKHIYRGREAATRLIEGQLDTVRALKAHGITVKINTILIPGINDEHVEEVARKVSELGADILNCVPIYPVEGTPFEAIETPSATLTEKVRSQAEVYLPQMHHCTRCRADACGLLGEPMPSATVDLLHKAASKLPPSDTSRPYVAIASMEGMLVNRHLGEASELLIFEQSGDVFKMVERRQPPPPGGGHARWKGLANMLEDCRAVVVSGAGKAPQSALTEAGIAVHVTEGLIEDVLDAIYSNRPLRSPAREHRCGVGCSGTGNGCG